MGYAVIAIDKDFRSDPIRVLIRGSKGYCEKYLASGRLESGWMKGYLSQPARWKVVVRAMRRDDYGL